jgi:hypothetical protein
MTYDPEATHEKFSNSTHIEKFISNHFFSESKHIFYKEFYFNLSRTTDPIMKSCSKINCSPPYGYCQGADVCKCIASYLYVPSIDIHLCRYEQYSATKTLILELMFPGMGCMYVGRLMWGLLKMLSVPAVYNVWVNTKVDVFLNYCFISIFGYALIFFHIKDLVLILTDRMTDYNGIKIYKPYY